MSGAPPPGSLGAFLPPVGGDADADALLDGLLAYVDGKGMELYPAQEEAILEIFAGKNVILATPTGSGKSMVALAMCFKALAEEKVAFWTAPIKALVNEKFFDLCETLGADNVGLLTGDATVNADAPVVCATAEILANLALREGARADVDYVVMDEFHFYSERERGAAWQIPLLELPQSRFLLMSATLGDTSFFQTELEARTGAECALVKTSERPVPLDFEYRTTPLTETITDLLAIEHTPIYLVHFTQREASERAQAMMSIDFLTKDQKTAIKEALRGTRFDSPFGKDLKRWLPHGVGVHHAGLLPKYRRAVEKLAQKGMLKVICGTDTLGVGVNVPIRTVVFTKLCKYDGEKTGVLTVRHFQQIAGRAGRKGFDDRGAVIAQAPEHVIENLKARAKAEGDAKKLRKLKPKKPPERGYAHWDEKTFRKLIESEPERLRSRFRVTQAMVLEVLSRQRDGAPDKTGCQGLRGLIARSHEAPKHRFRHGRRAVQIVRSLRDAGVLELGPFGARLAGDLQEDFSLNRALSLYAVEAIDALPKESPEYALDVLTVIEAILEDPRAVLRRQLDTLKGEAINAMKAEGVEYDERMRQLEEIDRPKPNAAFLYETFDLFRAHHPWMEPEDNVRPKSIAREMYERGLTFREFVKDYGLKRSEGVLLRYLSGAYKALSQNVPDQAKTDEVDDLVDWLGDIVRSVDSSLIDEWERMLDPDALARQEADAAQREAEEEAARDITRDRKRFTVAIRNAVWRVIQALARRDTARAAELLDTDGPALMEAFAPYWETHDRLLVDPVARSPRRCVIEEADGVWRVMQTVADPAEHDDWKLDVEVDVAASRDAGHPVLRFVRLGT